MPKTLNNVCMLATEHNVCKAYLLKMLQMGLQPEQIVLFHPRAASSIVAKVRATSSTVKRVATRGLKSLGITGSPSPIELNVQIAQKSLDEFCESRAFVRPNYACRVRQMIDSHPAVQHVFAPDINCDSVIKTLADCPQEFVIFCGGGILRRKILSLPKRFIHVHPGVVPEVKGADGILWSTLLTGQIGMSAFFMNEGIDTGDIIQTKEYKIPQLLGDVSHPSISTCLASFIVNEVDPVFRADLLGSLFATSLDPSAWAARTQEPNDGKVYYFMHEYLKNLAVERWGLRRTQ